MFRHRQQLRRWAARAVFVWLFGIATGVVQACLAPSPLDLGGQPPEPAASAQAGHGKAVPGRGFHHESAPTQHEGPLGHDDSLAKSNCQDFCEKSALAIPQLKTALDKVHDHALPIAAVSTVCPIPAAAPVPLSAAHCVGAQPPPIRIAFLRFAL
jgi:hypothetical protein